jgi:hypothetical protein
MSHSPTACAPDAFAPATIDAKSVVSAGWRDRASTWPPASSIARIASACTARPGTVSGTTKSQLFLPPRARVRVSAVAINALSIDQ